MPWPRWFKKWWESEEHMEDDHNGGPLPAHGDDWVVLPYRVAEACRLSMYTIAAHPNLPPGLQSWIANWLHAYNASLAGYFRENYGPDIFPVLEQISQRVKELSEEFHAERSEQQIREAFERWEEQFHGRDNPPTDPTASR